MTVFIQFYNRLQQLRMRHLRSELGQIVGALLGLALIGTMAYSLIEGWALLDALYATVITITTVGYGDFTPHTRAGRLFAIFFTLFAITIGGYTITTLAAYTIESRDRNVARRFRKRLMNRIKDYNRHYILCGADLLGTRIAEEFYLQKAPYIVIDNNEEALKTTLLYSHPDYLQQKLKTLVGFHEADLSEFETMTLPELSEMLNVPYFLADPTDDAVLIRAGIDRAAGLVAALPDDRDNLSIVIGARNLAKRANNDTLHIMTRANDPRNMRKMYLAGADFVRIPSITGGMEMASHLLHPEIGNWWYSRTSEGGNTRGMFLQVAVAEQVHWAGQTVSQIHQSEKMVIVSVKRNGEFISPPAFDLVLQTADIAIVIA